jgi:hypothetical protein
LILLAFFFPLALYLLLLGLINRRRYPLVVSGVWDGIGLTFGVSGFLLFAGPAILSALSERWRMFWLFGKGDIVLAGPDGAWPFWIFLSVLYFLLIVGGGAYYFWRQRSLTAIYNANAAQVERALMDVCEQLGLNPMRSGDLFLFGMGLGFSCGRKQAETTPFAEESPAACGLRTTDTELEQAAILEVESFPLFRHVTLRWDPVESPLRRMLESELSRRLSESPSEESLLGGWLLTLGFVLLSFDLAGAFFLILVHIFRR